MFANLGYAVKKLLITTAFGAALAAMAAPAYAVTCIGKPDTCASGTEEEIFLESNTDQSINLGNAGGQATLPIVDFDSGTTPTDAKNGNATIKSTTGKFFDSMTITVPGDDFTDFIYNAALYKNTLILPLQREWLQFHDHCVSGRRAGGDIHLRQRRPRREYHL
jgi:hypothetical protein